jgi:hypothetical protein
MTFVLAVDFRFNTKSKNHKGKYHMNNMGIIKI